MATTFADLYTYIRTILGDTDSVVVVYLDNVLDQQIRLALATDPLDLNLEESGTTKTFTKTLTLTEQATMSFLVARALAANLDNEFSYKTPVHSVRRKGGAANLRSYIAEMIDELSGGNVIINEEGELSLYLNYHDRYCDDYTQALNDSYNPTG